MSDAMKGKTRRVVAAGALTLALALAVAGCGSSSSGSAKSSGGSGPSGTVTMLLPENVVARWEGQDKPFFIAAMKKYAPNVKVEALNALNDQATQQAQAESALTKGTKALVVIAVDQKGAARIVTEAKQQKVPVIAYDRLIQDSPVAAYISVDGKKVGELQGKWLADHTKNGDGIAMINGSPTDDNAHLFRGGYISVLDPLFKSGKRRELSDIYTPGWDPQTAQQEMEQILTKNANKIGGVLSANDGMAASIISALRGQKLAGKVPVTGLDGTEAGLNLILRGEQGMSVYRSLKEQADKTAQVVAALLSGKPVPQALTNGATVNNGNTNVPWAQVTPQVITKDNVDVVIKDGAATKQAVCQGVASGVGPC